MYLCNMPFRKASDIGGQAHHTIYIEIMREEELKFHEKGVLIVKKKSITISMM